MQDYKFELEGTNETNVVELGAILSYEDSIVTWKIEPYLDKSLLLIEAINADVFRLKKEIMNLGLQLEQLYDD